MATMMFPLVAALATGPNPIHPADQYRQHVSTVPNGVKYLVSAPDSLPLPEVHVFGDPSARGEAYGRLLSAEVLHFHRVALPAYYNANIDSLVDGLSFLPPWLQLEIKRLAKREAPQAFELALGWLEGVQRRFNEASELELYAEIEGMARGVCAAAGSSSCDEREIAGAIGRVNVLPDLIKMQCSMLGAWGDGTTPNGTLVQLRALDFGTGPWANSSILLVQHPASAPASDGAFASLTFPSFVGVITGMSPRVALSEKVHDIHGGGKPPGTFAGRTTPYVIREMLQLSSTKEEAHARALAANRTWGVWLGVGDVASQRFIALRYSEAEATAFDDTTLPALTAQPRIRNVAYLDKHAQPSPTDHSYPDAINRVLQAGGLSAAAVASNIPRAHQTGDVHIAVYDMAPDSAAMLVAVGTTSANYSYKGVGGRPAWAAPFVRFEAEALWRQPAP